jgi:carbonic anhydrase
VNRAYVVVAAALLGGCEQLKAPQKLKELEGKVNELTAQIEAMKGAGAGSGSAKKDAKDAKDAKPGAGAGSGSGAGAGSAAAKPDEAKPDAKPDDKVAEAVSAGAGSAAGAEADKPAAGAEADKPADKPADAVLPAAAPPSVPAAGPADNEGHAATADAPAPADAGTVDALAGDPALANLLKVVAQNTAKTRPNEQAGAGARWSYEGNNGPAAWSSLDPAWQACSAGKAQSPIDIEPKPGTAKPIVFHYKPTAATLRDNGHALQADVAPGSTIEIGDATYQLFQLQFHTPSEHTIAGEHYPLEVQLVHRDPAGKLAIVSVLYDAGAESRSLAALDAAWPRQVGGEAKLRKPLDPSTLLPETRTVYRYTGSLTAPPCSEGVSWNVMRRTLSDSNGHLAAFAQRHPHNARDVQPRNDRKLE